MGRVAVPEMLVVTLAGVDVDAAVEGDVDADADVDVDGAAVLDAMVEDAPLAAKFSAAKTAQSAMKGKGTYPAEGETHAVAYPCPWSSGTNLATQFNLSIR